MDFSSAVQWWDEWQLRILVLGSLFVQFFLFSAAVRRFASPPWFRVSIWLAYLGGDALAIYALATLFNRHKQPAANGGGGTLEVLWAPVLLIHLGGLHPMTAYSIEDNELWRRHAITMVSQVTVALYVFCKSWSGEKRLLQAAILLFIVGIIRCSQKPWALKSASINSMVTTSSPPRRKQSIFAKFCRIWTSFGSYSSSPRREGIQEEKKEEHDLSLQEFVQKARDCVETELASDQGQMSEKETKMMEKAVYFRRVFVDVSPPYTRRLKNLKFLLVFDGRRVYRLLRVVFDFTFGHLYTKQMVTFSVIGICVNFWFAFLTLASLVVFSTSRKDSYNGNDVKVTYILFCCTTMLDLLYMFVYVVFVADEGLPSQKVSQYSLLSICARNKKPTILMKLAAVVGCKDYVNMHWYTEQLAPASTLEIIDLVLGYVKDGWRGYIRDAASYRRFNSRRGQWTLRRHRLGGDQRLGWSLKMAFDKNVLLWHIATDLCFHHQNTSATGQARAARSREISNYIAYLLFIRPEMLMPGSRKGIFTVACDDVEIMLNDEPALDESRLAQGVLSKAKQRQSAVHESIGDLVPNACRLAEALMELLRDEEKRWKVIEGVWVEMLCYSAGRGSGYQHAKSLGEGAELISFVWLLLSFMGMETFADRCQKPEPPETNEKEEDDDEESVYETASEGRAIEAEIAISG